MYSQCVAIRFHQPGQFSRINITSHCNACIGRAEEIHVCKQYISAARLAWHDPALHDIEYFFFLLAKTKDSGTHIPNMSPPHNEHRK